MPKSATIKAVIFDWGGVCCSEGEPFASRSLQMRLGLSPEQIAAKVSEIYFDYYRGKFTQESFWQAIMTYFHLTEDENINPEALSRAYIQSYRPYPEILEYARSLGEHFQVALLSNLTPEMRNHIRKVENTSTYFQLEVYSCDPEVAEVKPCVKPYEYIMGKLGRRPSECLFIDNSTRNIEMAKRLGMHTYLFTSPTAFLKDIKHYL